MESLPRSVTLHDFNGGSRAHMVKNEVCQTSDELHTVHLAYDDYCKDAELSRQISDLLLNRLEKVCRKCQKNIGPVPNACRCSMNNETLNEKRNSNSADARKMIEIQNKIEQESQKNAAKVVSDPQQHYSISEALNLSKFFHKKKSTKSKKMKHSSSEFTSIHCRAYGNKDADSFTNNIHESRNKSSHSNNDFDNLDGVKEKAKLMGFELKIEEERPQNYEQEEIHEIDEASTSTGVRRAQDQDSSLNRSSSFSAWLQLFLSKKRARHMPNRLYRPSTAASTMRTSVSLSVVHEAKALGSDGESLEVSPCTSDQMSTSSYYQGPGGVYEDQRCYIPNVKMRQKPPNRRWSEQDIQKRLSLPADIKLPQTVVDKLNRTPTLDNPLTRKSRRASLSEIGFGKLETYKKLIDLGEGTYATVFLGKSLLTGKSVALKEIRLEHEEGAPCTAIREVSLLRNLCHANVVTLHDVIYTDRILTLVFEFLEHDLREYMEEIDGFICMNNVKLFMIQLLRGLAYCHKRRILHRDLKPQNLLINQVGELKLADFGLARAQSVPTKTYSNEVVTLWYRPPDVLLGSTDYSTHIDMWGVGCILYELLVHKPMFPGSGIHDQLQLIFQRFGTPTMERDPVLCGLPLFNLNFNSRRFPYPACFHARLFNPPRVTAQCTDLLQKLLRYEGRQRISASDAMQCAFFGDLPQAEIAALPDTESVLSLPGVSYVPELPKYRNIVPS